MGRVLDRSVECQLADQNLNHFDAELIAYRFTVDNQLPRLPYMTWLDVFFLVSTLLVFFSLIEVVATIILDNTQKKKRAQKIDVYCRVIFPAIFAIASITIFGHPAS